MEKTRRKRVCIIGSGAAGMNCAWSLSRYPQRFHVEVFESASMAGGVATTEELKFSRSQINTNANPKVASASDGTTYLNINDGVQGGTPSYRNTLNLMAMLGYEPNWVKFKVNFGEWNNYEETPLIEKLRPEIKRFGQLLTWITRLEFIFIFVRISTLMRWFRFSDEFVQLMVFPLTALFFGTGNQTPNVSSAVFARVFTDKNLRLYDYDPDRFLSRAPDMFAFPKLSEMYAELCKRIVDAGVLVHYDRSIQKVVRSKGGIHIVDKDNVELQFDEIVFACNSETAQKLLDRGSGTTIMERKIMRNINYYDDVSVTHIDTDYMKRHYNVDLSRDEMYFVQTYDADKSKIEMSFDLSHYQAHARTPEGQGIYQSIFLNRKDDEALWTLNDINPSKILLTKWWRQFSHSVQHFTGAVPFWRFVQGKHRTYYAGSYTLVNTHEIAGISGLAAAYRLGADYPYPDDELALLQFSTYLSVIHGCTYKPPK